jgi:hypothetical protein
MFCGPLQNFRASFERRPAAVFNNGLPVLVLRNECGVEILTRRIAKRLLSMPPKPHKAMKLGKRKTRVSEGTKPVEKTMLQLDGVRIWDIINGFIAPPYLRIASRAIPASSSPIYHSHRASECVLLDDEEGKPCLPEK